MDAVETFEHNGKTIEICYDENPSNPREDFDNGTLMICFHKRYRLGDKHDYKSSDFNGWDEMEAQIIKDHKPKIILPLYLYDHSGITIATHPFSCPWDSGKIGYVIMTAEQIRDVYGCKRISKATLKKAEKLVESEVEVYDNFISGQTYGYVAKDENEEVIDSCFGYYGLDYIRKEVEAIIERWKTEPEKIAPPQDIEGQQVMALA